MTEIEQTSDLYFHGRGDVGELESNENFRPWEGVIGPWRRRRSDTVSDEETKPAEHPANYFASPELAAAVNTAIALGKPLLVTGNPGTGKSQLAERIAWELNLGPVLRFEAQSLSEANDLFYRFDLVGYLSAVELHKAAHKSEEDAPKPKQFLRLGPLGEAIVRSAPQAYGDPAAIEELYEIVRASDPAKSKKPRPSVVLIDEIDKASRDFPNDLLNGIERLEFAIRQMKLDSVAANRKFPPIVIITSNSERDLPAPFLRRCTFFHIEDPEKKVLGEILLRKFFGGVGDGGQNELPPFYKQLLHEFWTFRQDHKDSLQYKPGTSELIDWTQALLPQVKDQTASFQSQLDKVQNTVSTVAKHSEDRATLLARLTPKTT
jgi:MoxR-like ATPase